jgi:oligoendopeptidase F
MQEFLMKDSKGVFYELKESNMQTVLQELISELKSIESYDPIVQGIIKRAESKLEKEKEQIINAYEDGKENQRDSITNIYNYIIGEFYYNQTYNQNK